MQFKAFLHFRKFCRGTTLIEMLVVISIVALITGIVLANYKVGQSNYYLLHTSQKLVSDLRRAQDLSLNVKKVTFSEGQDSLYGFGVHITSASSYEIFADKDAPSTADYGKLTSGDYTVETITLPKEIIFDLDSYLGDVFFSAPFGRLVVDGAPALSSVVLTLKIGSSGTSLKTITINVNGLITSP